MRKGVAAKHGKIMLQGAVWGEDMILDTVKHMEHEQAVSLTHIQVFTLRRETLAKIKGADDPDAIYALVTAELDRDAA